MRGMRVACWLPLALAGCDEDGSRFVPPPGATAPETAASPSASTARAYYLSNADGKCVYYWVEGESRSEHKSLTCPRAAKTGEKIRLTGRTCMRESPDASRSLPVRCPQELYKAAEADEEDAGASLYKLREED
jgi:hypothetical protein